MKKAEWKKGRFAGLKANFLGIIVFLVIVGMATIALSDVNNTNSDEGRRLLEESVHRAIVSCYAIEGSYPETFEYLAKNYPIAYDKSRFIVHYEIFASNLMPTITVVSLR